MSIVSYALRNMLEKNRRDIEWRLRRLISQRDFLIKRGVPADDQGLKNLEKEISNLRLLVESLKRRQEHGS